MLVSKAVHLTAAQWWCRRPEHRNGSVDFGSKPSPIPPNRPPSCPLLGRFGSPTDDVGFEVCRCSAVVAGRCRFAGFFLTALSGGLLQIFCSAIVTRDVEGLPY
ncbi:hypothetical protein TIFTF001_037704 [Ficus carica]|uniref:Uncharacterized protein n=1 Tax=Ficus carica TaxID=3494 RepID=A0AA88E626_FICCA|nr:hypothetical protein TIFTF001_037704 [Ficus carica]